MLGNFMKGAFACATLGLATVGGLTFVPDESWDYFPEALAPVRAQLAEYGIAPIKYQAEEESDEPEQTLAADSVDSEAAPLRRVRSSSDSDGLSLSPSQVRIRGGVVGAEYVAKADSANESGTLDVDSLGSPIAPRRERGERLAEARQNADTPLFSGVSTAPREIERGLGDSNGTLAREEDYRGSAPDPLKDEAFFNDEPNLSSQESLDAILTDDDALNSNNSLAAQDSASEFPSDPLDAEPSNVSASALSSQVETPYVSGSLSASYDAASAPSRLNLSETSELNAAAPSTLDAPLNTESSLALTESPASNASEQQGYLARENDLNAPAAQTDPSGSRVQSFDEYLNSQSTLNTQNSTVAQETQDEQAFVSNASASFNASVDASSAESLDSVLQAFSQVRSDEQTRAIFMSLNRILREQGPRMTQADLTRLNSALDRLAYEIFYDPHKHILEPARQVAQGETLATIAREYDVSPELLAAVNSLQCSADAPLAPGSTLKVMPGPASAELSTSKKELLLRFNGLYAGRFKFGVPQAAVSLRGRYQVESKIEKPSCDAIDVSGAKLTIPGGAENNPLGACWIGLKGGPGLQGTNRPELIGTVVQENGGFVFSNQEISQLNVLLPLGASVTIGD